MEADEGEGCGYPSVPCHEKSNHRNEQSEDQRVQIVVILGEPKQRMTRMPCQHFGNDS
jgi:hypothetical protein